MDLAFNPDKGRRNALGKGLGALIPGAEGRKSLFYCPVDQIVPTTDQPRRILNPASLNELADSIRESGVLQPVLVRREDQKYRLIAGERRWRAARMAGLDKIPALVKDVEGDELFALALIENVQREDLTPLEEAAAYDRLLTEFGYTQQSVAAKVGKARSTIANTLRLLDLPPAVQDHVQAGRLTAGHARAVLAVPRERRETFAAELIAGKASVRRAEELAKPRPAGRTSRSRSQSARTPSVIDERGANLRRLERLLSDELQARVTIADHGGEGRIELHYTDDETLQEIIDRLLE